MEFIVYYTFFFLSKEYNKVKNYQHSFEIIDDKQESQEDFRKTEKEDLLKFVFEKLDEFEDKRILKVFELRYFKTPNHKLTTWSEIGKALDLTGQACINLHCKGLSHLKRKIKHEQQNLVQFTY